MFANGPGHQGSIFGWVIQKTQKLVIDTFLLNTQPYKVQIKDKVGKSGERSSALSYTSVLYVMKREPSGRQLYLLTYIHIFLGGLYIYIYIYIYIYTHPSSQAECDTRSIFKPGLMGLNSKFSFLKCCHTKV